MFLRYLAASLLALALPALADEERATPEQAKALVKSAIVHYDKVGRQKALADFNDKHGQYIHKDLYVNVYDMQGNCMSHVNERQVGKNMIDIRDVDGHYIIRERLERAAKDGSGWQEYKYFNPGTRKVEPKSMYFEKHGDLVFAAGAYKPN